MPLINPGPLSFHKRELHSILHRRVDVKAMHRVGSKCICAAS